MCKSKMFQKQITVWIMALTLCLQFGYARVSAQDLKEAERLNAQVVQLYNQGRYGEAIVFATRALAIKE